jgi:hypothetical protein
VEDARQRLKLLHDPAVDTLGQLMEDRDPRVRLGAVSLLHKVSPLEAAPPRGRRDPGGQPSEVVRQRLALLRAARPAPQRVQPRCYGRDHTALSDGDTGRTVGRAGAGLAWEAVVGRSGAPGPQNDSAGPPRRKNPLV